MAKKENTNGNGTSGGGDITMLRDILIGQQINEYDGRFDSIEDLLKEQETAFNTKIQTLEKKLTKQLLQSQEDTKARLNTLEKRLISNMQEVDSKLHQQRTQERRKIGQMLLEMSKQFLDKPE